MNALNFSPDFSNYFNNAVIGLNNENKAERAARIKNIFSTNTPHFVDQLQARPMENINYQVLEDILGQVDQNLINEVHPYIEKIQRLATFFSLSGKTFNDYQNLDLEQIRNLQDPDLKALLMANHYNQRLAAYLNDRRNLYPQEGAFDIISSYSKQELIAMGPYLSEIRIKNPPNWNAQDVYEILAAAPNIKKLTLKECPIEVLPPLDSCERVSVTKCGLREMTSLQSCKSLDVSKTLISLFPPMPVIHDIRCEECNELIEIPSFPRLGVLYASHCKNLQRISPDMDQLFALFVRNCVALEGIAPYPNMQELICAHCNFESLPEFPWLEILNVFMCSRLRELPSLENVRELEYFGCPLIDENTIPPWLRAVDEEEDVDMFDEGMPEAPAAPGRPTLNVRVDEFEQNPLKVLLEASDSLLDGRGIPFIKYFEPNGEPDEAMDLGGLTKDFLTKTITNVLSKSNENGQLSFNPVTEFFQPILDPEREVTEHQRRGFRVLGALLNECLSKNLRIDRIIHPSVFKGITALSAEELDNMPDEPEGLPDALIFKLLFAMSPEGEENFISVFKKSAEELTAEDLQFLQGITGEGFDNPARLLEEGKQAYLQKSRYKDIFLPVVLMAKQMRSIQKLRNNDTWDMMRAAGAEKLQERIEGVLTPARVFESIVWKKNNVTQKDLDRIIGFVQRWLNEAPAVSPTALRDFVETVTSLRSISEKTVMRFGLFNLDITTFDGLPRAHTCFSSVNLSGKYSDEDYETFKTHLEALIASRKFGSGFGIR